MIHTIKGFSAVSKPEVDVFLEFSCFFCDPAIVGDLISGSFAFSKSILNIWNFLVQVLLKPRLKDFEHYLATMWNEHTCTVVWTFFGIAFLWDCNENWSFPVLWPLLSFPNLLTYWAQHLLPYTLHLSNFYLRLLHHIAIAGLPWWLSGKESACQCRRCEFDPWSGKISWGKKWQHTPVF